MPISPIHHRCDTESSADNALIFKGFIVCKIHLEAFVCSFSAHAVCMAGVCSVLFGYGELNRDCTRRWRVL